MLKFQLPSNANLDVNKLKIQHEKWKQQQKCQTNNQTMTTNKQTTRNSSSTTTKTRSPQTNNHWKPSPTKCKQKRQQMSSCGAKAATITKAASSPSMAPSALPPPLTNSSAEQSPLLISINKQHLSARVRSITGE